MSVEVERKKCGCNDSVWFPGLMLALLSSRPSSSSCAPRASLNNFVIFAVPAIYLIHVYAAVCSLTLLLLPCWRWLLPLFLLGWNQFSSLLVFVFIVKNRRETKENRVEGSGIPRRVSFSRLFDASLGWGFKYRKII